MMRRYAAPAILLLALAFPLAVHEPYYLSFASRILVYALAATSLNLVLGYGGMISFGHAAFLGTGAYVSSILIAEGVTSAWIGWPVAVAVVAGSPPAPKALAAENGPWQAFTPERLGELTASGRAVFVDFTAAWCVTCQVNKRLVLNTESVQQAFAQSNVALLRADWTRRDPVIGQALAALGRNGIPVYVLYRPGREPLLLPEVLQKSTIADALATL